MPAICFKTLATGMKSIRIREASVQGLRNLSRGTKCQDCCRHAKGKNFVAIISDGAGSAKHGRIGAKIICDTMIDLLKNAPIKTIKTHTALSVMVEVGDFRRFATPERLASYLGLVPGEDSSGARQRNTGITKAGNSHVRRLLVESAQGYTRGMIGYKSKDLKRRQQGNTPEVIAYADRANERLRRKYYHMVLHNHTHRNVAITAIARELACFIWGMMTDHIA